MQWDDNTQLRITTWPDRPVPLPRAVRVESQLDATETVILPVFRDGVTEAFRPDRQFPIELTGETYLELEQVNLDDPYSILAFVNRYGCLGGWSAFHDLDQQLQENERDAALFILHYEEALDPDAIFAAQELAVREQMTVLPDWIPPDEQREWRDRTALQLAHSFPPVVETLDAFRFAARLLLDLKTAWQVTRDRVSPTDVQWRSDPLWQQPSLDDEHVSFGESPLVQALFGGAVNPAHFLGAFLEPLLHWFQPKVDVLQVRFPTPLPDEPTEYPSETVIEPQRKSEHVPLYAICALELFNHIIDNATYHTCANDRCQRTFVHQHGRAQKGQHRSSGVLYCSPECARATAQREYRRRRRSRERGDA